MNSGGFVPHPVGGHQTGLFIHSQHLADVRGSVTENTDKLPNALAKKSQDNGLRQRDVRLRRKRPFFQGKGKAAGSGNEGRPFFSRFQWILPF